MVEIHEPDLDVTPSPLPPTAAELAAWHRLSRDEQVARWRDALSHPDCDRVSDLSMKEVLAEARKRLAADRGA